MRGLAGVAPLAAAALAGCTSAGSTVPPAAVSPSSSGPAAPSSAAGPASPPLTAVHNPDQGQVALYFGTDAGGFAAAWAGRGMASVFRPQGRS